jgi:hypothetical protein
MKRTAAVLSDYWQLNLRARNSRVEMDLEGVYFSFLLYSVVLNDRETTSSFLDSV